MTIETKVLVKNRNNKMITNMLQVLEKDNSYRVGQSIVSTNGLLFVHLEHSSGRVVLCPIKMTQHTELVPLYHKNVVIQLNKEWTTGLTIPALGRIETYFSVLSDMLDSKGWTAINIHTIDNKKGI